MVNVCMKNSIKYIILGNLILSFAISEFIVYNKMIAGGCVGIANILNYYFKINLSISLFLINVILFLLGYIFLGKDFAIKTIISTIIFPVFFSIFSKYKIINFTNIYIDAIIGGILIGIGIYMIIKTGASTGGMDIPPIILNKYFKIKISVTLFLLDIINLCMQLVFSNKNEIFSGILVVLLTSFTINFFEKNKI